MIKDINENTIEMKSEEFIEMERGEDSESDLKDEEVLNDHVQSLNGTIKRLSKNVEFEKRVFIREIDAMKIEIQNTRNIIENLRNVSTFRMFLKDNSPFCAKSEILSMDYQTKYFYFLSFNFGLFYLFNRHFTAQNWI